MQLVRWDSPIGAGGSFQHGSVLGGRWGHGISVRQLPRVAAPDNIAGSCHLPPPDQRRSVVGGRRERRPRSLVLQLSLVAFMLMLMLMVVVRVMVGMGMRVVWMAMVDNPAVVIVVVVHVGFWCLVTCVLLGRLLTSC